MGCCKLHTSSENPKEMQIIQNHHPNFVPIKNAIEFRKSFQHFFLIFNLLAPWSLFTPWNAKPSPLGLVTPPGSALRYFRLWSTISPPQSADRPISPRPCPIGRRPSFRISVFQYFSISFRLRRPTTSPRRY